MKHREETKRLELIAEAVRYCQHVRKMGMPSNSYAKALREPIYFLWERRKGSKLNCAKYRSRAANGLRFGQGLLVYDHAVPVKYLLNDLLGLANVTPEAVRTMLEGKHGPIAVLITKDEDARLSKLGLAHRMPEDWGGADHLARYRAAEIELEDNMSQCA
jgi:hypothetical protein